jgi:hypothetical protein
VSVELFSGRHSQAPLVRDVLTVCSIRDELTKLARVDDSTRAFVLDFENGGLPVSDNFRLARDTDGNIPLPTCHGCAKQSATGCPMGP